MKTRNLLLAVIALSVVAFGAAQLYAAVTESSTNVPLAIPDNGNGNSTLNFSVNGTITDANLTVNITHTWDSDIALTLASPSIAVQALWSNCGGSGDNMSNTVIDNDAAGLANCAFAGAPFAGSFQPTAGPVAAPPTGSMMKLKLLTLGQIATAG